MGAVVETTDGFLLSLCRSSGVAEGQGMMGAPGGHPEPEVSFFVCLFVWLGRPMGGGGGRYCGLAVGMYWDGEDWEGGGEGLPGKRFWHESAASESWKRRRPFFFFPWDCS